MRRSLEAVREAAASAVSQPVASFITIMVVAAMCATILLTNGRTVGAQQAIVASFEQQGTRTIVMRATAESGLNSSILDRLATLTGIESAEAFGPATDVENSAIPGGTRVSFRTLYQLQPASMAAPVGNHLALASKNALSALGIEGAAGGVRETSTNAEYAIVDEFPMPAHLAFLDPVVVAPAVTDLKSPGQVSVLIVVVQRPETVATISQAIQLMMALDDPTTVSITTSEQLAVLSAIVENQLGLASQGLLLGVFAISAVLVSIVLYALVMMRRKDFGRRRALGASRGLIMTLLLIQVAILAAIGALVGSVVSLLVLVLTGDPVPDIGYLTSISFLAILCCTIAAALPAWVAARRDPIKELRVP